jgi:transcriptional regulator GlxA family with amidase domain
MKHISILVPIGDPILSSVVGPFKIFNWVNGYLTQKGKQPIFDVHLVGITHHTDLYGGAFSIKPDLALQDAPDTDLIIIPALMGNAFEDAKTNAAFNPWIVAQYKRGAEIASLCTGAFLLATTGLVDGKRCATHWFAADEFRKAFPKVNLVPEKIIVDEDGIYSSGGAYSFLNLILYLVEKFAGRETSIACSKMFEIEYNRESQSVFTIFNGQKDHEDGTIKLAQQFIERNFQEKMTVEQLASMFALSRRNLERRFKKATTNTLVEYMHRVKVEAAKKSLETGREHVNEIMYRVGYNDSKTFRDIFKKYTGLSPVEYKNRYRRTGAVA